MPDAILLSPTPASMLAGIFIPLIACMEALRGPLRIFCVCPAPARDCSAIVSPARAQAPVALAWIAKAAHVHRICNRRFILHLSA
ncbi:MAG TPA: hypothetical protein VGS41_12280, partial [Chthonomonadales bacterium]|nr:hypothetical protein [Chthonomonadales bacterium]